MLKKFSLENYKNFEDCIFIDFQDIAGYKFSADCIEDNLISKMLIYGRNATGKTNFGKAIMDLKESILGNLRFTKEGRLLNADSEKEYASFSYTFLFDHVDVVYHYTKNENQELREEELIIDGQSIFKCDFENSNYNFDNLKYIKAETANVERYMQSLDNVGAEEVMAYRMPFLRWLINNVAFSNDAILIKLANYTRRMNLITVSERIIVPIRFYNSFLKSLEEQNKLQDLEDFLNIMGIECKLVLKKLPGNEIELYFAHTKLVPFFENASSGTLSLFKLYYNLFAQTRDASLLYVDEFDAFYHYEMAENVIEYFKKKLPKCQIIMTSHNTNLMTNRLMRPDCLFILSRSGILTSLCKATLRELREGHNLEKMYISGEFEKYE